MFSTSQLLSHGGVVFTPHGILSGRVMSEIADAWPDIEIYSIDEAFLDLRALPSREIFCLELQKKILKNTGIPTSVGIGKTKTLAKLANFIAKRELKTPVFNITDKYQWPYCARPQTAVFVLFFFPQIVV